MKLEVLDHPLIHDRLGCLRSKSCSPDEFRRQLARITPLLVAAATARLSLEEVEIETPLEKMTGHRLARPIVLVPILRAGLAFLDEFHRLLPEASVAHLGMARDEETLQPVTYYQNFPASLPEAEVFVLDPMLATGGSAIVALKLLKNSGASRLHFVSLVASPEGLAAVREAHDDVEITTAAIDRGLNDRSYIVPGLGDAGDRAFGTL